MEYEAPPLRYVRRLRICRTREEALALRAGEPDESGIPTYGTTVKAARFLRAPQRFRAYVGGVGSGKSWAGIDACIEAACERQCKGLIVAPTYGILRDVIVEDFKARAGGFLAQHLRADNEFILANGSTILLRSADRPDLLRGPSVSWAWGDEAAQWDEYVYRMVIARLRERGTAGRLWLTTTPRGRNHWLFRRFVTPAVATPEERAAHAREWFLVQARTDENVFLHPDYVTALKTDYGVTSWFGRQELLGEFVDPEGALFKREWFPVVERAQVPELAWQARGWDLAFTTKESSDYTVGVKLGVTRDAHIYVLDVIRGRWEWPEAKEIIVNSALVDGPECSVEVETVAAQTMAWQELLRDPRLMRCTINPAPRTRDKKISALPLAGRAEAGRVSVVNASWTAEYLDEMLSFVGDGKDHDDQVDATVNALHLDVEPMPRAYYL
jgi:predicted phage terminase large subunit-like protein